MLDCIDPSQVFHEVAECCRTYPDCYICLAAFDSGVNGEKVDEVQDE